MSKTKKLLLAMAIQLILIVIAGTIHTIWFGRADTSSYIYGAVVGIIITLGNNYMRKL